MRDLRNTHDTGGKEGEGISGETQRLEDGRCIVENGVDTSCAMLSVSVPTSCLVCICYRLTPLLEKHGPNGRRVSVDILQ